MTRRLASLSIGNSDRTQTQSYAARQTEYLARQKRIGAAAIVTLIGITVLISQ
jgi:hypothetical protein